MRTAEDLLDELNTVDESNRIEAKRGSDVGRSIFESIVAFSNEPRLGGGHLLLGVSWSRNRAGDVVYAPEGVPDPDKMQSDLASQSTQLLNRTLRLNISVELVGGRPLVVVEVPELEPALKPIYFKKDGLPKGAYRRIGGSDVRCNDDDVFALRESDRPDSSYDLVPLERSSFEDLSKSAMDTYRRLRRKVNPRASELDLDDAELMRALNAVLGSSDQPAPTIGGVLMFGKPPALRRLLPSMRVDFIRVPGTDWSVEHSGSIDIRQPLLIALPRAVDAVMETVMRGFELEPGNLQSRQEPILPDAALREAIANAVMHRNYRKEESVQVIRYSDRVEIRNPGYSLKNPAQFQNPGSQRRNPNIAAVLHDLNFAETKGTGLARMVRWCREAGLVPPKFVSDRINDEFVATLYLHHLHSEDDRQWLASVTGDRVNREEASVLMHTRNAGSVDNATCRDLTGMDTNVASGLLRRLRDRELLAKRGSGNRTFYELGPACEFRKQPGKQSGKQSGKSPGKQRDASERPRGSRGERRRRIDPTELKRLLVDSCRESPQTAGQLAEQVGRTRGHLIEAYLSPMIASGELEYLFPDSPRHPDQKYVAPKP